MGRRIAVYQSSGGSSGGGTPTIGNVEWGPNFGGLDGDQFAVGANLDLASINLANTKTCGCNVDLFAVDTVYNKTSGAHLSGTVLGAPFWQEVTTAALTAAGSSIVVNKPSGSQVGHLLVAFVGTSAAAGAASINVPSGWTATGAGASGTGTIPTRIRSFIRIVDGTEGSTVTFTFTASADQATAEIHRVVATDPTNPLNAGAAGSVAATALVTDPVIPSVTTTVANCLVFAFLFHSHLALSQTHTPPASHLEVTDFQSTVTAVIVSSTTSYRVFSAAAATGTCTVDCTETVATDAVYQRLAIAPGSLVIAS